MLIIPLLGRYWCLQGYSDYTGKFGAAGVGILAAFLAVARGKRRLAWG